ncbi:glycosyltransferase family 4 protein [Formosa sp. A9]|uniref:glycosyltransferase family 4 protein n=1 Tax=Formosa sp. A9 TaxID=3442641 RepID=UPI003EC0DEB3
MLKTPMLFVTNLHFRKDGNGGQQRTYFLIKELSKHFDLHVLSPYSNSNNLDVDANFIVSKAVRAKKTLIQNRFVFQGFKMLNNILKKYESETALHQSNLETYLLKKQLQEIKHNPKCTNLDTIVFDTLAVVQNVNGLFKNKILNAHNFDSELAQMSIDNKRNNAETTDSELLKNENELNVLQRYEHNIDAYFSEIWVCSKADEVKFKNANPKTNVRFFEIPNGSDIESRTFQDVKEDYKNILFVGTLNYFPNVNGLQWFVENIFGALPKAYTLTIVGKSPNLNDFKFIKPFNNIRLVGEVEDIEAEYKKYDVVVVPLLEGSGTRLKILEAMSYGKLVLSTAKGIEGIDAIDGEHFFEFNSDVDFLNILKHFDDKEQLLKIRKNGRRLMKDRYSWQGVIQKYVEDLEANKL